jgi:hypothetical protein
MATDEFLFLFLSVHREIGGRYFARTPDDCLATMLRTASALACTTVANRDKDKEKWIISLKKEYDVVRKSELLRRFDEESQYWRPAIVGRLGRRVADIVLREAGEEFEALIPQIPYIGGDENHLTESLIGSVRYLALYKAMKKHGKTAEETGKILYDTLSMGSSIEPSRPLTS